MLDNRSPRLSSEATPCATGQAISAGIDMGTLGEHTIVSESERERKGEFYRVELGFDCVKRLHGVTANSLPERNPGITIPARNWRRMAERLPIWVARLSPKTDHRDVA